MVLITPAMVTDFIIANEGIVRIEDPTYIRRTFLDPGKRLGLPEEAYDTSHQDGGTAERWFISTTYKGEGDANEGLSNINLGDDNSISVLEALSLARDAILGKAYADAHPNLKGMGFLFKVYDFKTRIPHHFHQMQYHASQVGLTSKDECYHFPEGVEMGDDPTTFFGFHEEKVRDRTYQEIVGDYIRRWENGQAEFNKKDPILNYAYEVDLTEAVNGGWYVDSGILHAPGSALTMELQENSDVFGMLQAFLSNGNPLSVDLLYRNVHPHLRDSQLERSVIDQINWRASGNANFEADYKVIPRDRRSGNGWNESWVFYGKPNNQFSGTKLTIDPGKSVTLQDKGAYGMVVWDGDGRIQQMGEDMPLKGTAIRPRGSDNSDEFLITYTRAKQGVTVENTGTTPLQIYKVFGPGINNDAPLVPIYTR